MSDVTKPVILDETGQKIHPKIDALTSQIEATIVPFESAVDEIVEAMDRLDIVYYVEKGTLQIVKKTVRSATLYVTPYGSSMTITPKNLGNYNNIAQVNVAAIAYSEVITPGGGISVTIGNSQVSSYYHGEGILTDSLSPIDESIRSTAVYVIPYTTPQTIIPQDLGNYNSITQVNVAPIAYSETNSATGGTTVTIGTVAK